MECNIRKTVRCCIVGGGPAGMMLGYLLARSGIDVCVLEKHADFLRDFRGDTIHPSTLEVMYELGLLEEFLKRPHQEIKELHGRVNGIDVKVADFSGLPTHCRFIVLMPQWDFLNFIAEKARKFSTFQLKMRAEVTDILEENGRVAGVRAKTPEGTLEVRADLVLGADGRHSIVRERAGLPAEDSGAPIDVLWMRLTRRPDDADQTFGIFDKGKIMAMLNRGDYWQCAYVIPKGGSEKIREQGLESFRVAVMSIAPFLKDRVQELQTWDQIKLLTVVVDRLKKWYKPGLLCIGDAAHAMSPVGGVGINLAIQDAVATANILADSLRTGDAGIALLQQVQRRRTFPTVMTQRMQIFIQNNIFQSALSGKGSDGLPFFLRLMQRWAFLRRIPARLVGVGFRPEHVKTGNEMF